ncbi:hypothetical protein R3P38DRAFT_2882105, partial [Favolaschia claudopus]
MGCVMEREREKGWGGFDVCCTRVEGVHCYRYSRYVLYRCISSYFFIPFVSSLMLFSRRSRSAANAIGYIRGTSSFDVLLASLKACSRSQYDSLVAASRVRIHTPTRLFFASDSRMKRTAAATQCLYDLVIFLALFVRRHPGLSSRALRSIPRRD